MNALEFSILRSTMANLRGVRTHIARGDHGHAFLMFSSARHEWAFGWGLMANEPGTRAASWERVRRCVDRVEAQLLRVITRAAIVPRHADRHEVSAAIAEGITTLNTRYGHDVTDEQAAERGANICQALTFIWEIFEPVASWPGAAVPVDGMIHNQLSAIKSQGAPQPFRKGVGE